MLTGLCTDTMVLLEGVANVNFVMKLPSAKLLGVAGTVKCTDTSYGCRVARFAILNHAWGMPFLKTNTNRYV